MKPKNRLEQIALEETRRAFQEAEWTWGDAEKQLRKRQAELEKMGIDVNQVIKEVPTEVEEVLRGTIDMIRRESWSEEEILEELENIIREYFN